MCIIDEELKSWLTTGCVRVLSAGRVNAADDSATVSNDRALDVRDLQTTTDIETNTT